MPIIRYEIGDTAILADQKKCACGSKLPIIAQITGRIANHFKKKDGTLIYGDVFSHLFYGQSWISQFQVIQDDYGSFEIKIIPLGKHPDKRELSLLNEKINRLMNERCRVKWVFTDNIPTTPQGKHLYTRCLIK